MPPAAPADLAAALVLLIDGVTYTAELCSPWGTFPVKVRLTKAGAAAGYLVEQFWPNLAPQCECPGWKYRARSARLTCRHVAALVKLGLLPGAPARE